MTNKEYDKLTKKVSQKSPKLKDFILSFLVGGLICALGQVLFEIYSQMGMIKTTASAVVSVTLIFIAVILTGFRVFDKIAKHAGAGTLVPITGFANSVASPAIEFKSEGQVMGVGAKMFTIAGPVLVFGITASAIYGLILWLFRIY